MTNLLYTCFCILVLSLSCSRNSTDVTSMRIMDGYIVKEKNKAIFYLQDMESAALTRLDFVNEDEKELSFEDFGHVEVIGQYNTLCECLIVEQILPTRELLVLEPEE